MEYSFTKEREMGTLTLLKSQGISSWKWLLGKWSALFLPIFAITATLFLSIALEVLTASIAGLSYVHKAYCRAFIAIAPHRPLICLTDKLTMATQRYVVAGV